MLCCCLRVRIIKLRFKGCFVVYQGLAIQHWVNSGAGEEEEAFTQVLPIVPEDVLGLGSSGGGSFFNLNVLGVNFTTPRNQSLHISR